MEINFSRFWDLSLGAKDLSFTPTLLANSSNTSRKSQPSIFSKKVKTSPASPQPKHLKTWRSGEIISEGVFSLWNGQRAAKLRPVFFRGMYEEITSTISTLLLTSAT